MSNSERALRETSTSGPARERAGRSGKGAASALDALRKAEQARRRLSPRDEAERGPPTAVSRPDAARSPG